MNRKKSIVARSPFLVNVTKLLSVNLLIQILSFFLSIVITRIYSENDFGLFAKFMSMASLFVLFASLRLEQALILPKDDKEANALMSLGFLFTLFAGFACFLFLFFFEHQIGSYFNIDSINDWIFTMPIIVVCMASFNLLVNYKNRQKKYNQLAKGQLVAGVSNPLASIGFHYILNNGLIQALLLSNFLASIYLGFSLLGKKILYYRSGLKQTIIKYYRFPTFNMLHALINNVSSSLPIFMLSPVFENYYIGLFSVAVGKAFRPINLINNVINQVFSKKMIDDLHSKKKVNRQFVKVVSILVALGALPFLVLYFYAPEIFSFVFGGKWFQAGIYLKLLLPWLFFVYINGSLSFIPNLYNQQKNALFIEIIYLVLRILALSYGVSKNSIEIALWAYSMSGVLVLSTSLVWYFYLITYKNISIENE